MKIRHPEKQNKPINPIKKKPDWIRSKLVNSKEFFLTKTIVNKNNLVTVCQEANCPNITECWSKRHATFMIMGDTCTRACTFCNVKTGKPNYLDPFEPERVATSVSELGLTHVVITSVNRDDLKDNGLSHFLNTLKAIRYQSPQTTIEILTPDFMKNSSAANLIGKSAPDVFNHNLETVPRLYNEVRPGARYFTSLKLLNDVKSYNPKIFTKSGLMVGLGESKDEIIQVMDDLRAADVDFLTIGQYLQPTIKHHAVIDYITPELFNVYRDIAISKGFLLVSSSPFTRSSYHADEDFLKLKMKRNYKYQ